MPSNKISAMVLIFILTSSILIIQTQSRLVLIGSIVNTKLDDCDDCCDLPKCEVECARKGYKDALCDPINSGLCWCETVNP